MKTAAVLLLGIALPALAGGPEDRPTPEPTPEQRQEWPQVGDTVYLSAALAGRSAPFVLAKPSDLLPLNACVAVRVVKRTADSAFFRIKDETGTKMLEGPWLTRMHRTEAECRAFLAAKGQPHLEAKGFRYVLVAEH